MKNKRLLITTLILTLIATGVIFYYRNNISSLYSETADNVSQFAKKDLEKIVTEFKKEVLTPSPLNVGGQETDAVFTKEKIIAQTNIQRYDNGQLPPLLIDAKLEAAALAKAEDMFKNQYFEHVSPSGIDPGTLVKNAGYDYIVTGENLILGNFSSEQEIVQKWMDSPGHRANILNDRVTEIGVAIIKGTYNGQTVWIGVQEFGLPLSACQQPSDSLKNDIESDKGDLDVLTSKIEDKKNEINSTNPRSSKYNDLVDEYNILVAEYNQLVQETKNLIQQFNNQVSTFNECVQGSD